MQLREDPSKANVKKAIGTVSPKSAWTDPHVNKALDYLKSQGKDMSALKDEMAKDEEKMKELQKKSPLLYDAIAGDAAANAVYKVFTVDVPKGCAVFDPVTFSALVRRIKTENPSLFPLRNFVDKKPLASPRIILVPTTDKADAKFNDIKTAAATPTGEFIFNTVTMQKDMNWAFVTGIKPKSKKYKSNGGEFPDEWCIVEFTVLHEFFHYTHADFHYQQILKGDPTIINWVGDFRSNYDLIKAGHEPYKDGLYNDHINYDRQKTYKEMYDLVEQEMKKLQPPMQKWLKDLMKGMGDDHSQFDGPKQPRPAHMGEPTAAELEEAGKKASEKIASNKDGAEKGEEHKKHVPKADKGGPGGASGRPSDVDWKSIKPRYSWKSLLDKLVKSSDTTEVTYQKVHRRNITGVHIATQTGAGVIRPGEKVVPANLVKLCLIIDSSGSMHHAILKTFAELNKLFTDSSTSGAVAKQFAIIEFSSDFHIYNCTIGSGGKGSATEIQGVEGMRSGGTGARIDLSSLMSRHQGGGTNFSEELVAKTKEFLAQKYNVVVMSDSDIIGGSNRDNFLNLYHANHHQVYALFDSAATWQSAVVAMKQASANFSHF